jgi:hypothetical protein
MIKEPMPDFDVCLIDADSLFYFIAWGEKSPALARKAFDDYIASIIEASEAPEAYVFMKGNGNFRFAVDIEYKQHRKDTLDEGMLERVKALQEYAKESCIECHDAEADDWVGHYANEALKEGKNPLMCHIDKDLNMLPGWHYNFKKKEFYFVSYSEAYTFMCMQFLAGDPTDNVGGLPRVGMVKAKTFLSSHKQSQMLSRVRQKYQDLAGDDWENKLLKTINCIYIRNNINDCRLLTWEEIETKLAWKGDPEEEFTLFNKVPNVNLARMNMSDMPVLEKSQCPTGSSSMNDLITPSDSSTQSSDQPEECTSEESNASVSPEKPRRGRPAKPKS